MASGTAVTDAPRRVAAATGDRDDPGGWRTGRDGRLRLRFERRDARTVVTACAWTVPLQVLTPVALDDRAAVVSILNPTGGLVGGDRLLIEIDVGPGAHACVTTPSATKVYRTAVGAARQTVTARLGAGAVLEWVPDHTIPFAGSAFRQTFDAEVGDGATLILLDAFAAGRVARGETWRFTELDSALGARDEMGPIVHDRFVLRPGRPDAEASGAGPAWDGLGFTEGCPYFATMVLVTEDRLDAVARAIADPAEGWGARPPEGWGARPPEGAVAAMGRLPRRGAVVRCLAVSAPAADAVLGTIWGAARGAILGAPPLDLRKP